MRLTCTLFLVIAFLSALQAQEINAVRPQAEKKKHVRNEISFIIEKDTFPSLLYQKYFGAL
ncbi:hypothetical protein EZS27_036589, partial [termite gut metagenome]